MKDFPALRLIDPASSDPQKYTQHLADCVILTHDHQLLLQQRPENWGSSAGCLTLFGGHVEEGEAPLSGVIREINEETGGLIDQGEISFIGALTEEWTKHTELVHIHFWHDRNNTITGCYEAEARHYPTTAAALKHPKIMDYTAWALLKCHEDGLIP